MLFQIRSYLKFLLKSTNQHGIHSPFAYDLITNCFYDSSNKDWYLQIANYKQLLIHNKSNITIEDFGAGSNKLENNKRIVAKIAKIAGISKKRAQLLGRIINYSNTKNILEIGTSLGIATASMSFANN